MKSFTKQLIFIALGVVIITTGALGIWAVANRGAEPVAWWRLDEGYGTSAYDASGNINTGTITNAVWKNEPFCKTGKCLYFDGVGDYITVSDSAELRPTDGVTIETWARPNNFDSSASLIKKDQQYSLDIAQGVPNFKAYANSQWHSAIGSERAWLFREPADNQLTGDGGATFTQAFGYRSLTPSSLTSEKGVLVTRSDDLRYSRGSQSTPDGTNVVYENFDPNQGTLEFWVRPNWNGDDGLVHKIFGHEWGSNYFTLWKHLTDALDFRFGDTYDLLYSVDSNNFPAGEWRHVVVTWSTLNTVYESNYTELYLDGVAVNGTTDKVVVDLGTQFRIGNGYYGDAVFDGTISGRVLNRPLTSTEVTALYNSGAGHTNTFTVTPDTVWMGTYSDDSTTAAYWHTGKSVSAISDGDTEDTLTTASGTDNSFSDNDRVVVYDGTGYKVEGCVDGAPSDTSLAVDNCSDADPGTTENVGVFANLDGDSQYFYCTDANCPETGITGANDLTIQAWIRPATIAVGTYELVTKYLIGTDKRMYRLFQSGDDLGVSVSSDGTSGTTVTKITSGVPLTADKWQHIAVVYDASEGTADFYKNGYFVEQETGLPNTIADKDPNFTVGINGDGTLHYGGGIKNVALFNDIRSAAEILTSATNPNEDLSAAGNIIGQWMFNEAAAATAIDNTQGDAGRDLTPYDGGNVAFSSCGRTQQAFVSKNLLADPGMEN